MEVQTRETKSVINRQVRTRWKPPSAGTWKCNTDGAWSKDQDKSGVGLVLRDHNGQAIWLGARAYSRLGSVLETELEAIRWAIISVTRLNYGSVIFETNSCLAVSLVYGRERWPHLDPIITDIQNLLQKSQSISIEYSPRESNRVADRIARESLSLTISVPKLYSCVPIWVSHLVEEEKTVEVTDQAIWTVGRYCPNLEALDISELYNLTDKSVEYIIDGCRSLNSVNLSKTRFSDVAVAAFLEVCGGSLNQLCLNNVRDVGQDTAISLAKSCKRLRYLDLSWCRKLTEEELARILNCCSSLESLKLYGWTHVEEEFLEKLSRTQVRISGLKMTSVFAHLDDTYQSIDAKFC